MKPKGSVLENSLLLGEDLSFYSVQDFTRLDKPTHILEGNLFYSKSTDLNVNLIQNTPTETLRITFDHRSGYCGPAKLTHKIRHHTLLD